MNETLAIFFYRDRKLALVLFGVSLIITLVGVLTLDFVLVSFSGLVLQIGVIFFIGADKFAEFFASLEQKIAGIVMVCGLLLSLKGWYKLGGLLEWGGFLYLFRAFRGMLQGIFSLLLGGNRTKTESV